MAERTPHIVAIIDGSETLASMYTETIVDGIEKRRLPRSQSTVWWGWGEGLTARGRVNCCVLEADVDQGWQLEDLFIVRSWSIGSEAPPNLPEPTCSPHINRCCCTVDRLRSLHR